MTNHETLINLFDTYLKENEKFMTKGNKSAGTRTRKALAKLQKVAEKKLKTLKYRKRWYK